MYGIEEQKILSLNHKLEQLVNRFPKIFDSFIFKDRDRLLAFFEPEFIHKRSVDHLLRFITSLYIKKKNLLKILPYSSKTRFIEVRFLPTKLDFPFVSKRVIGVLVQISLNNRYELFDQDHLLKALQSFIPHLRIVKGSIYSFQAPQDSIKTIYVEFEKTGNLFLTLKERQLLLNEVREEIANRVERLVPAVFMTRNQEEILRNILTLSQEIQLPTDCPQVMISFETQKAEEFVFNLIYVRIENRNSLPIENLLNQKAQFGVWTLERKQLVKYLNQHSIFAYVFRILLPPVGFIVRNDGALNFFSARTHIANHLKMCMGEFRDFNGGILIKQEETLLSLKQHLPEVMSEMIENLYYSITPIEMQAILGLNLLKTMVTLFLKILEIPFLSDSPYIIENRTTENRLLVMLRILNKDLYEIAKEHLLSFEFPEAIEASLFLSIQNSYVFGYIIDANDTQFTRRFLDSLKQLLQFWMKEINKQQVLRLTLENSVSSFDPRIGGDSVSAMVLKMLFEGLMRINAEGNLENAIAEKIEISPDSKTYLFHLRQSVWSNGLILTSHDFEYAWKKILSPNFDTVFAYLLYAIKNAKAAKRGLIPMSEVGIESVHDYLLKIELENPSPHFLECLTLPYLAPIPRNIDINEPNWPLEEGDHYICNGAFIISKNNKNNYILSKNPLYWDKDKIYLDKVLVNTSYHHSQAYDIFSKNVTHWLGGPLGTWDDRFKPEETDELIVYQDNGVFWCNCNTQHPLLKNKKIRRALSYAIDREQLLNTIPYYNKPAYSLLPAIHSQIMLPFPYQTDQEIRELFLEGIQETGISLSNLPSLTICYTSLSAYGKAVADFLRHSWKTILGIDVIPVGYDYKHLFQKPISGNFEFILTRWQPWINDPFYTLNCLKDSEEPVNFSRWSHPLFQNLLTQAEQEKDPRKQNDLLAQIERLLQEESPIIPLFQTYYQSMKKKSLSLTPNHILLDFKWARFI